MVSEGGQETMPFAHLTPLLHGDRRRSEVASMAIRCETSEPPNFG